MSTQSGTGQIPIGSNLFELIEFTLTRKQPISPLLETQQESTEEQIFEPTVFAVNVAKVREVIRLPVLEPSLGKRPEVLGVFQLRGVPIPAIHLACALGFSQEPLNSSAQVLVTEFSGRMTGFVVAHARRIRRVSWNEVMPPQKDLFGGITGMMLDEKRKFVFIIDFEKVLSEIEGQEFARSAAPAERPPVLQSLQSLQLLQSVGRIQKTPVVLIVDDSTTARRALLEIVRSFPCDVLECGDGEQAWQESLRLQGRDIPFMIISDVEMPRLDGYSLVRRMRTDARFINTPLLLHSSLTGEVNKERALAAGADAFIGKFNKRDLLAAVETCLSVLMQEDRAAS